MESFAENLSSPSWWISVILVGIVISYLGNLITRMMDKFFSTISSNWRNRSEKVRTEREAQIQILVQNPSELRDLKFSLLYPLYQTFISLIITCCFIIITFVCQETGDYIGTLIFLPITIFCLMSFSYKYKEVSKKISLFQSANDRLRENRKLNKEA
jgi:hypothetical protein